MNALAKNSSSVPWRSFLYPSFGIDFNFCRNPAYPAWRRSQKANGESGARQWRKGVAGDSGMQQWQKTSDDLVFLF